MLGSPRLGAFVDASCTLVASPSGRKFGAGDELTGYREDAGFFSRTALGSRAEGLGTRIDAASALSACPMFTLLAVMFEADADAATKLVRK